jgi:phage terminase large subunit-like protein
LSRGGIETGLTLSAILEPLEDRTIGIDGGGLDEFARFSHAGPGEGHADCSLWGHAFIVSEGLERRKAGSIAYEGFERDGDPTVIERKLVDGSLKQVASSCPRGAPATRG